METIRMTSSNGSCDKGHGSRIRQGFGSHMTFLCAALLFFILSTGESLAQGVGISESSITPDANAILELRSTLRGFLAPRLTNAERATLGGKPPAQGMLVYDTEDKRFYYWDNGVWNAVATGTGAGTVTSVATGSGLTGGPITTTGTIALANGSAAGQVYVTGANPYTPALATMSGDATISSAGALTIANNAITYGKMQAVSTTSKLLGSSASGTAVQELTLGTGLSMSGATLNASGVSPVGSSLTSANIWLGNSSDLAAAVAMSGDAAISNTGSVTVSRINGTSLAGLGTGILKNTTGTGIPSIAVAGDFPTLNQNTTGTASNVTGTVAIGNGGTGATTKSAAFDALSPMSASGDIIYGGASGTGTRLAKGSDTQILTLSGGLPTWASPATNGTVTSFSAGTLNPLFTTSVATATTTPALSFSLSNAGAYTLLGNNTGGSAAPAYFSPTLASALFANQGTTTQVLHGNGVGNPSWGAVALGTDVSGTLPIANGGTNSNTALSGSSIMISNGTRVVQGAAGTTTTLLHGNASGAPSYSAVSLTADVSGTLPVGNGGTGATTLTGVVKGNGSSAFTAATAGTDYSAGTSALSTGILKSTTGTGALSIAAAGTDYAAPGTVVKVTVYTGSATWTPDASTKMFILEAVGAGGGGGGVIKAGKGAITCAAGGGAGAYLKKLITIVSGTGTVSPGTAGTAGANTGGNGGNGGNTTFTYNTVTYTANGGTGGAGDPTGGVSGIVAGGNGGTLPSSGDINIAGGPGRPGITLSGTAGMSGGGGASFIGRDAAGITSPGAGVAGLQYGGGGGGALDNNSAAAAGGAGASGAVIIWEFK